MNELCLFAGIGGGSLGTKLLGFETVCYVEKDSYCIDVLTTRIREGYLCDAPIWDDIKTFNGKPWRGLVDIITAGFPCQPFSVAGKQKAEGDDRNMWPDTIRVIREVRPGFCLLENVPGLLSESHGYFGQILRELSASGYNARWCVVSAADVGAPHLRKRLWVLAYASESTARCKDVVDAHNDGLSAAEESGGIRTGGYSRQTGSFTSCESAGSGVESTLVADSDSAGLARRSCQSENNVQEFQTTKRSCEVGWWDADPADAEDALESQMGRVADGIPHRIQRLKAIGNAQVPAVVATAWRLLTQKMNI